MRFVSLLSLAFFIAGPAGAAVIELGDGTKIEVLDINDAGDKVEATTRYGVLYLDKSDIVSGPAEKAPDPARPPYGQPAYMPQQLDLPPAPAVYPEPRTQARLGGYRAPDPWRERPFSVTGVAGKAGAVFLEAEVYSIGGADKEWRENYDTTLEYAIWNYYYAGGVYTSKPGFGITVGSNLAAYADSPLYVAATYARGPSATVDLYVVDYLARSGQYSETIETSYFRLLVGRRLVSQFSEALFFALDINAGVGGGVISSEWSTSGAALGYGYGSGSERWTGLTWSVGPSLFFNSPLYGVEFGIKYTSFPTLKEGDDYAEVVWSPLSLKAGLVF